MSEFKQRLLVLSCNAYHYVKDGQTKEGITISYIPSDKLDPFEDESAKLRGGVMRGVEVIEERFPYDKLGKLGQFPAIYEVTQKMVSTLDRYNNRVQKIIPVDIDFVGTVDVVVKKEK